MTAELRSRGHLLDGTRILLVEDDAVNRQVAQEFLELAGVCVTLANNGSEALEHLANDRFDAVLMDINMPVMDGLEATQRIRANPRLVNLPIIALTAEVTSEERARFLTSGMNDFIAKPFLPEELVATMQHWISPGMGSDEAGSGPSPTADAAQLDLPGFDFGNVLKMLGGKQSSLVEVLLIFADDMAGISGQIKELIERDAFVKAHELAHRVKGAAGSIGATELLATAGALDNALKAGSCRPEVFKAFEDEFVRTLAVIDALRRPQPQGRPGAGDDDADALRQGAEHLSALLKENELASSRLFDELERRLPPGKYEELVRLHRQSRQSQYASAQQALRNLASPPDTDITP